MAYFTLCTWNIHEGGHGIEDMFSQVFEQRCDLAVINEANGWRRGKTLVVERLGFDMEILATPTTYDIAIIARRGLLRLRRGPESLSGGRMHHGVLHCVVSSRDGPDVHVLATHLSPHSTVRRREEARHIVALVQKLSGGDSSAAAAADYRARTPVVVAGDMNALSPLDKDDHAALLPVLRANDRLRAKFLVPGSTETQGEIDYMPMRILLTELVDVAVAHDARRKPHPTVPTALHVDKLHAAPMRLDYILFNDAAAAHLLSPAGGVLEVNALRDPYTDSASDHYPLVLTGLLNNRPQRHHRSPRAEFLAAAEDKESGPPSADAAPLAVALAEDDASPTKGAAGGGGAPSRAARHHHHHHRQGGVKLNLRQQLHQSGEGGDAAPPRAPPPS